MITGHKTGTNILRRNGLTFNGPCIANVFSSITNKMLNKYQILYVLVFELLMTGGGTA
jgi:hypothetical protein